MSNGNGHSCFVMAVSPHHGLKVAPNPTVTENEVSLFTLLHKYVSFLFPT